MPASRRAKIVYKIAQLIGERADELALTEVRDNGKTIATAKGELGAIVECFEFYAGAATKNYGETLPPPIATYLASTVREPAGVVARSFRGIFRCCSLPGKSRPRSRPVVPSFQTGAVHAAHGPGARAHRA